MSKKPSAMDIINEKVKEIREKDSSGFVIFNNGFTLPVQGNFTQLVDKLHFFSDLLNTDEEFLEKVMKSGFFLVETDNVVINPFDVQALIRTS